jgi:thiamine-phosphate pyrophosphorylase
MSDALLTGAPDIRMSLADDARRLNLRARRHLTRDQSVYRGADSTARAGRPARLPALILLTDEQRLADPVAAVAGLPRGSAVILRHYGIPKAERATLARRLRAITRRRGNLLLIAADDRGGADLARAVGADGLHLSEWLLRRGRPGWPFRKPGWRVTASVHSLAALRLAAERGVDAVLLSPIFPTASHPRARTLGPLRFAAWARASRIPVYALGGIDARSAARLRPSRACGLAGIGAFGPPVDPDGRTV